MEEPEEEQFIRLNQLISYDPRAIQDLIELYPSPNLPRTIATTTTQTTTTTTAATATTATATTQTANNKRKLTTTNDNSRNKKLQIIPTPSEPSSPLLSAATNTLPIRCSSEPISSSPLQKHPSNNFNQNISKLLLSIGDLTNKQEQKLPQSPPKNIFNLPSVKSPSKLPRILSPTPQPLRSKPSTIIDEPLVFSTITHGPDDLARSKAQNPTMKFTRLGRRLHALQTSSAIMRPRSSSNPSTTATITRASRQPSPGSSPTKPTSPPIPPLTLGKPSTSRLRARRASRPPEAPTPTTSPPQPPRRTAPRVDTEQVKLAKLTKQQTNLNKKRFCVIKVEVIHMDQLRPPSPEGNFRKGASSSSNINRKKQPAPSANDSAKDKGKQPAQESIEDIRVQLLAPSADAPEHVQDREKRVRWNDPELTVDLEELYYRRTLEPAPEEENAEEEEQQQQSENRSPPPSPPVSSSSSSTLSSLTSSGSPPCSPSQPPLPPSSSTTASTSAGPPTVKPILKLNFLPSSQPPPEAEPTPDPTDHTSSTDDRGMVEDGDNTEKPRADPTPVYRLDPHGNLILPGPSGEEPNGNTPADPLVSLEPPFVKVSRRIWRDH
ncbi:hypothetical protein PGT21_002653 [Puccinia graminis f. sp. tritici]|uniref:Uncharacterized protein n=1 Tax=Puccinia graminis f. sp. tritici TaxID=56615 RepID=A0A5B0PT20_PUCGR|nr:hypothetical protein PGTUg99_013786 [Puccinia graminis f. sp. tritici]KAA1103853.1 hypothetical protein PGT21_002653 [Puccinia graminis f. sp. tritici]